MKVCPKECSVVLFQPLQESSYKSQAGTKKKLKAYAYGAIKSGYTPAMESLCPRDYFCFVL